MKKHGVYFFNSIFVHVLLLMFWMVLSASAEMLMQGKLQHIEFVNNHFLSNKELINITGLSKGLMIQIEKMDQIVKLIESIYKNNGFYFVDVTYTYHSDEDDGSVALRLNIAEGSRVYIEEVIMEGVNAVPLKKLYKQLNSRPGLIKKEYLTDSLIEEDRVLIESYYRKNGVRGVVKEIIKDFSEEGESVVLYFVIDESILENENISEQASRHIEQPGVEQPGVEQQKEAQRVPEVKKEGSEAGSELVKSELAESELTEIPANIEPKTTWSAAMENDSQEENSESVGDAGATKEEHAEEKYEDRHNRRIFVETQNENTLAEKQSLEEELKRLRKVLSDKEEVESLLSGLLASEKSEKAKLKNSLESLEIQNNTLKQEVEYKSEEVNTLKMESKRLKSEIKETQNQLKEDNVKSESLAKLMNVRLEKMIDIQNQLAYVIRETQQSISQELDKIELSQIDVNEAKVESVVEPKKVESVEKNVSTNKVISGLKPVMRGLQGEVVVVNDQLNFLVINLGAASGAYLGMRLAVFEGEKEIAKIKIFEVRKSISAVEILNSTQSIKVGDRVSEILS